MLSANRMLGPFCVSTTRKDRFASARPSMHCDIVNHSPDSPARTRGPIRRGLSLGTVADGLLPTVTGGYGSQSLPSGRQQPDPLVRRDDARDEFVLDEFASIQF